MHPDLVKLIELQAKDVEVGRTGTRVADLGGETAGWMSA